MSTGIFGLLAAPSHDQFHRWQGRSGQWWITTVFPLFSSHITGASVYVMVRRDDTGRAHPLYIGQTSDTARRMEEHLHDKVLQAIRLGGNELHVHLLAKTEAERFAIETDLRNGHDAPLNCQSSAAVFGGLLGLGAAQIEKRNQTLAGLLAG
ncbi:GIY-YIG nuclease family protein [Rhizobium leguminosarum]|uniref:GIY-YIG nuclease family protein n=1 Tax=Rhizobium leguminosarum TaxID=384 RepID=UPI001030E99C|nr:GIY-YIG nuclease family protein [Rhizobium leguminosarum]TBH00386.1 GIY-YIG nuclease family protein [Rhizobium leguminosarum]TBH65115.1 GIY-YIG nuclease family protein [Rhizobium leguminosarum]